MKAYLVGPLGSVYAVKVSGQIAPVRLDSVSSYGGWNGTNLSTGREVRIRTAAKLRYELERNSENQKWRPKKPC